MTSLLLFTVFVKTKLKAFFLRQLLKYLCASSFNKMETKLDYREYRASQMDESRLCQN